MNKNLLETLLDVSDKLKSENDNIDENKKKYALVLSIYIDHFCKEIVWYKKNCTYSFQKYIEIPIGYDIAGYINNAISKFRSNGNFWDLLLVFLVVAWEKRFKSGEINDEYDAALLKLFLKPTLDLPAYIGEHIEFVQSQIIFHHIVVSNKELIDNARVENNNLKDKIISINKTIEDWKEELNRLEQIAKDMRYKLNFVGLSSAYKDLLKSKYFEKSLYALSMFAFLVLIVLTPFFVPSLMSDAGYYFPVDAKIVGDSLVWLSITSRIIVSAPFFLIFLYIFRISLRNFQSVRAQIVQLQIRQAVCQFVQAYSDYVVQQSAVLKETGFENGAEHLKKFESLVFSGLTPDPDNVPSTFDGLDQIIEAVKALRK